MLWIGLTGSIGAGKSTVAEMLRKAGFTVVEADQIAHAGLRRGTPTFDEICAHFGSGILSPDGEIDRRALGRIIFADPGQKSWLERLLHPMVQKRVRELRTDLESKGAVLAFYEVPLLFEKNLQGQFDKIIVVWVSDSIQVERLRQRNAWTEQEIQQRLAAQWPIAEKINRADFTINNDGNLGDLQNQVQALLQKLR